MLKKSELQLRLVALDTPSEHAGELARLDQTFWQWVAAGRSSVATAGLNHPRVLPSLLFEI